MLGFRVEVSVAHEDSAVSMIDLPLCGIPGVTLRDHFLTMGLEIRIILIVRKVDFVS